MGNNRSKTVLGLSFGYHDAAAAIIADGEIVAAAQEERFTRIKNDPSLPVNAIRFCLEQAGCDKPDFVVYYEKPLLKFDRIISSSILAGKDGIEYLSSTMKTWAQKNKFQVLDRISDELGIPRSRVKSIKHHDSHASSAFYCSQFNEATIVTVDGVGEYETAIIAHGRDTRIKRLKTLSLPHSIGLFYSAITAYLGFEVNEGEYKVMGMAAFGKPLYYDRVSDLIALNEDGTFCLNQKYFNFLGNSEVPYTQALVDLLGPSREPESPFFVDGGDEHDLNECRRYANIAASAQKLTEEVLLHVVAHAVRQTGVNDVCMAGGVALNSLANGRLQKELGIRLYVHPAAGDAGGAAGAALYYYHNTLNQPRAKPFTNVFVGKKYDANRIESDMKELRIYDYEKYDDTDKMVAVVAGLLREGAVIGWLQGGFEWGPRALGARSIVADPTRDDMRAIVNEKIKFREPFRPFAPAVIDESTETYFEAPPPYGHTAPEYFMLSVCPVKMEARHLIPAVTHADGSARIQRVRRETAPLYYDLIREFGKLSGVPIILNTSFNLRGEPIVSTPADAIRTFSWSDMDALVLNNYLIRKDW